MNLRQNMQDVQAILTTDETLLRLLYYKPVAAGDDPLDSGKPDILARPAADRDAIVGDVVRNVRNTDGLAAAEKCRLVFYPRLRRGTSSHLIANQDVAFDIYCHYAFEQVDARSAWVADRVNELIFNKRLSSVGRTFLYAGNSISAPADYTAYRLIYTFGSENY